MLPSLLLRITNSLSLSTVKHDIHRYVNYNETYFQYTALAVFLCPFIWNILARICRIITTNQSSQFQHTTCYLLAAWIFAFSSFRDYLFHRMIAQQPTYPLFTEHYATVIQPLSYLLIGLGQTFVLSSFYKLGITGTFLGDYCGILMDAPVRSFPFNVLSNPMYVGSTLSFLGSSLYHQSLAGVVLTAWIYLLYKIALAFEEPYTNWIYQEAQREKAKRQQKKK